MNILTKLFAVLSIMLLVVACQGDPHSPQDQDTKDDPIVHTDLNLLFSSSALEDSGMQSFSSKAELKQFVNEYSFAGGYYYGRDVMMPTGGMMAETDMAKTATPVADQALGGTNDFSGTNNQHVAVDEADILKTDGEYIYTVTDNTVFIIKAYPGEDAKVVSEITFDNKPQGLFLEDDVLVVMGTYYNYDDLEKYDISARQGMSYVWFYDVSDKEDPILKDEFVLTGSYDDARLYDGKMYVMTKSWMQQFINPVPFYIAQGEVRDLPVRDVYFRPTPYNSPVFYRAYSFDMRTHDDIVDFVSVATEGNSEIYVSEHAIYLGTQQYINEYDIRQDIVMELLEPRLTDNDNRLIDKIMHVDDEVLSYREKKSKVQQIYNAYYNYMNQKEREDFDDKVEKRLKDAMDEYEYLSYTMIDKIALDDGSLKVVAHGRVPGQVNNQFSFDEYDGVLRVATTIPARWSSFDKERTKSFSAVFTLDDNLAVKGKLMDLAEGESIYSTRFMGERLYLVTFRQVDPFFVIDLSNPNKLKMLGELKIPGFSRYLHPYDENTIIGIGQDADEDTSRTQGLKISLFDVRDVEHPEEVAKYVTDSRYAQSSAMYEHKAFLFSKEKNLLVIPVNSYTYRDDDESYNGAFVFDIDRNDIELRGLIDHSDGWSGRYYGALVERSLYINELLYTKSPHLLRVNELDDLSSVAKVQLKTSQEKVDDFIVY